MEGRPCRTFTARERGEIWQRWRQGENLAQIALALGRRLSSIDGVISAKGGIAPKPRRRSVRALSLAEREEISRGIVSGRSVRDIAGQIGRAPSTVSRELRRHGGRDLYRAASADSRAWKRARRPKLCLLATNEKLRDQVAEWLSMHQWSPQQISAELVRQYPSDQSMRVSHETIYRTLFVQARGALKKELVAHLRTGRKKRRPASNRKTGTGSIVGELSIRERPAEAEDRAVPGHWEGDLLCGSKASQIATLVERRSRFVMLIKVQSKNSIRVADMLARHILRLPIDLRRTLTWDRGVEMASHKAFTLATDVKVYFCDPSSPWQRGSNENTNGLLRQYFPKGTDLSVHSQDYLDEIAARLNGRPRQTLGWAKPGEFFTQNVASTG
jgi:IS30 family transposase